FLFGSLLGTVIGGLYIIITSKDRRTPLPFGTFLGVAAIVALFWGNYFWNWYYGVSGGFP
ncbi:MAG: prepilin peptidase, partial [Acidobacteria bacterium]|nr:prepilin peptidase [Acidobacteriota bacterium]